MNQDFTVQISNICLKKKFVQRGSSEKKNPAQAVSEKKKFVQAGNSPPTPPHHFSNGPSLITYFAYASMCLQMSKMLLI